MAFIDPNYFPELRFTTSLLQENHISFALFYLSDCKCLLVG